MLVTVDAAKTPRIDYNEYEYDEYGEQRRLKSANVVQEPIEIDYTLPKNDAWLADIDFSAIKGEIRPVGSGVCETAKCDGTDNDRCFETCGNVAYADDVYGCPSEHAWSLTFDDGPSEFTHELLDILDTLDVKATFCVMGAHVKRFPDIVKRAYEAGHQIASHTYSHPHLMSLSNENIVHEIRATEEAIVDAIGVKPTYIRPPYGEADQRVKGLLKQMGYKLLMWNADPTDYNVHMLANGPALIQEYFQKVIQEKNTLLNAHSDFGFISLQHDLYKVSIQQVPQIVQNLQAGNYTMLTSAECLGDDEPHVPFDFVPLVDYGFPSTPKVIESTEPTRLDDPGSMARNFHVPSMAVSYPASSAKDPSTTNQASGTSRVVSATSARVAETTASQSPKRKPVGKTVFKNSASHLISSVSMWVVLAPIVYSLI